MASTRGRTEVRTQRGQPETRDTRYAAGLIFVIRAPRPPPPAFACARSPSPTSAVEEKTRARSESRVSCLGSQVSSLVSVLYVLLTADY